VREIAKEYGISPTTVQKWKKRKDLFDRSRDKTVCPEWDAFEEIVFIELLRLSRYPYGKLMRYLAPISTRLPDPSLPLSGKRSSSPPTGRRTNKPITASTVYRRIKRYASGALVSASDTVDAAPGSFAIHKIRVKWASGGGEEKEGEIILLMDRGTGLLFAQAYHRVRENEAKICMARIEQMFGHDILAMNFVMSWDDEEMPNDRYSTSTVLNSPRAKKAPSLLANTARLILEEMMEFDFPLQADGGSPAQQTRAVIPGKFDGLDDLNEALNRLVNKINLTERHYYQNRIKKELTPKNLLAEYSYSKGKMFFGDALAKQLKLPREWDFLTADV